jgi:D-alanine-D-alanine ligase
MSKMRVLVLFDTDGEPPADQDYSQFLKEDAEDLEVEFEVGRALIARGHDVRLLGFKRDVGALLAGLQERPFDVVFNLVERFRDLSALDYTVPGILEMLGHPYTGAGPSGLILSRDKALSKMVLSHEGIATPRFHVVPRDHAVANTLSFGFPMIVKPLDEDASVGIAHASVVKDAEALAQRVKFVHEKVKTDAIVEEFIAGRELYVGVLDGEVRKPLVPIEMCFKDDTHEQQRIATFKTKWSTKYRESRGIENRPAEDLTDEVRARLAETALGAFRVLGLRDYARIDVRLTKDGQVYVVEANPNPYLADGEDYAWAAEEGGYPYPELLEAILESALRRGPFGARK